MTKLIEIMILSNDKSIHTHIQTHTDTHRHTQNSPLGGKLQQERCQGKKNNGALASLVQNAQEFRTKREPVMQSRGAPASCYTAAPAVPQIVNFFDVANEKNGISTFEQHFFCTLSPFKIGLTLFFSFPFLV